MPKLNPTVLRLSLLGFRVLLVLAAGISSARAQRSPIVAATPSQMVDALNSVYGSQGKVRANHANGILLGATFTPSPAAATVTRAIHFQGTPTPVTVRFSNFGGFPDSADADPGSSPYGMSLKFGLPDGSETDLVMHSFNGFPAATTEQFRDFLLAMGKSPAGSAHPTALDIYAESHERAKNFLTAQQAPPLSFTSQPYFGVNTFRFVDAAGSPTFGRYRIVPTGATRYLSTDRALAAASDYLHAEIRQRLIAAPIEMKLFLQIAGEGDCLDDPSIAWPERRPLIELGTLSIRTALSDSDIKERALVFLPGDLPDGIEVRDPMLNARTKAYSESFERRQQ